MGRWGVARQATMLAIVAAWLVTAAGGAGAASQQAQLLSKDKIPVFYNQGIARIRGGWILSGTLSPIPNTDVIVRTDEHYNVLQRNEAAIPSEWRDKGYVHIGDIDVVGDVIYAPFEQPDF